MILDFYLLELSKNKQTKQKIDDEVCPQIENIVQELSSQLSWNFPRVNGAYKLSYVDEHFHIHKILNGKESTLPLLIEHKSFDRYYIIDLKYQIHML